MEVFKNIKEILELCNEELIKNNKETYATLDYEDLLELKEMYDKLEKFYAGELYTAKQLKNAENIGDIIKENKELKEKYKRLSIEAQATAFDDMNKDTEGLLRVLLKQGEITLDEKGYYQRKDFDWEENLTMMGLMKKREKNFYIPDDSLDEYTKQLENQLKEYNEIKEIFKKYYVMGNETMYDGCCKMQDEIDELKEENKELKQRLEELELQILEED